MTETCCGFIDAGACDCAINEETNEIGGVYNCCQECEEDFDCIGVEYCEEGCCVSDNDELTIPFDNQNNIAAGEYHSLALTASGDIILYSPSL